MHVDFLATAKEIALSHQEKWDGSGYPQGLAGEAIPLSARLMAVADVYDALISRRVYKEGMPHEKAVSIIRRAGATTLTPTWWTPFAFFATSRRGLPTRTKTWRTKKSSSIANRVSFD
jgi:putative two-component system response regulator